MVKFTKNGEISLKSWFLRKMTPEIPIIPWDRVKVSAWGRKMVNFTKKQEKPNNSLKMVKFGEFH